MADIIRTSEEQYKFDVITKVNVWYFSPPAIALPTLSGWRAGQKIPPPQFLFIYSSTSRVITLFFINLSIRIRVQAFNFTSRSWVEIKCLSENGWVLIFCGMSWSLESWNLLQQKIKPCKCLTASQGNLVFILLTYKLFVFILYIRKIFLWKSHIYLH